MGLVAALSCLSLLSSSLFILLLSTSIPSTSSSVPHHSGLLVASLTALTTLTTSVETVTIPSTTSHHQYHHGGLIVAAFTTLTTFTTSSVSAVETVTIGAIVQQSSFYTKKYKTNIQRPIRNVMSDPVFQDYDLQYELIQIEKWSPNEILERLSEQVIARNISTLLYLGQPSYLSQNVPAEQYLVKTADFLGMPVIAWIAQNLGLFQLSPESLSLQLTPSTYHQCTAMLEFLSRYDWHDFSILTGGVAGHDYFINTMRDLTETEYENKFQILSVYKITDVYHESTLDSTLAKLAAAETRVILLYVSESEAKIIMPKAASLGLTSKEYIWVASKSAADASAKTADFPLGMFGVSFVTDPSSSFSALETGTELWIEGMRKLLEDMAQHPNDRRFKDLTLTPNLAETVQGKKWKHGKLLYEYMRNVSTINNVQFTEDGTLTEVELNIMNVRQGRWGSKEWKKIGTWHSKSGILLEDITWPGDAHTPPQGRPSKYHLKVVTLKEPPYVIYTNPDSKTGFCSPQAHPCRVAPLNETIKFANASTNSSLYQCCSGLCIDLLRMFSKDVGFDYELFEVDDEKWGAFDKDVGEWNGLVKAVMDEKADMVMTSLKITPERSKMISFSVPFLETGITIIVAVRDGVISPTAFLEPYDYPSWCLILVFSVHASGAAIFIFEWLSPSGLDRGNKPIREHRFSLFRSFWLIWAMLFGAAVNVDNPRGVSSRCLANIWALFAVVFTASYTANLAAFMITKVDYDRLTGIQDWRLMTPKAHKPPFKFATVPHGSTETNLMNNFPSMYEYMRQYNRSTVRDGIKAVKDGEINAFIYDSTVLEYLAGHDDGCKLRTVGNWYAMTGYGVGFPKGSKWIDIINKYMIQYQHDGELERLQNFWLAGACDEVEEGESSKPLGILNFTSAFILLAGGMLLGGLLLLLEHVYFKFFRAKLRKWDRCGCCGLVSLSMGKSLTFEQSVREAIELQRHHKCKNPVCETHVWKLKHELDLALLKIDRMQKQIRGENGIMPDRGGRGRRDRLTGWRGGVGPGPGGGRETTPPAIGWKAEVLAPQQSGPPTGWKAEVLAPQQSGPPPGGASVPWGPSVPLSATSYPSSPPPSWEESTQPPLPPPGAPASSTSSRPATPKTPRSLKHKSPQRSKKGSKSLPSSPTKTKGSSSIPRAPSFPNSPDKKTRSHRGNMYVEVPDSQVEKETVL